METRTKNIRQLVGNLLMNVNQTMFDMDYTVKLCLIALYTDGHVLLEGNPGMGKTDLVKALAESLKLPFGRIQFTPDLMPSDITGSRMPDLTGATKALEFRRGPIFTSFLLADEINRATAKTQSALLEAMAERQVTVLGEQYSLNILDGQENTPFVVLATQNPIDHEGTYELPEAQLDRFMFMVVLDPPTAGTLDRIVSKRADATSEDETADATQSYAGMANDQGASIKQYQQLRREVRRVVAVDGLKTHVNNMVLASNRQFRELVNPEGNDRRLEQLVSMMRYGLGPRAAISLMLGAKAWSLLWGDSETMTADGADLAQVLVPSLRHRMKMEFDWERHYSEIVKGSAESGTDRMAEYLFDYALATAPRDRAYVTRLKAVIGQLRQKRLR